MFPVIVTFCTEPSFEISFLVSFRFSPFHLNSVSKIWITDSKWNEQFFFLSLLRNLFCDYYNSQQKIYCKRLRVLCPEHTKEPKVTHQTQFTGWLSSITQTSWPFVSFFRRRQKLDMFWDNSFCAVIRTLTLLREPIRQGAHKSGSPFLPILLLGVDLLRSGYIFRTSPKGPFMQL